MCLLTKKAIGLAKSDISNESSLMGRVAVRAVVESLEDVYRVSRSEIPADQARHIELQDALVDTGATGLSLPSKLVRHLGLLPIRMRRAVTTVGVRDVPTFAAVRLTVDGRECVCDVTEIDDACPVLIGQVPLELMDFIVDPARGQLVGNPAHGGQHMMELM
jgi:predicted aspartyl protease